ncbi:L,D-transpeptidase [Legionella genomosp. 1]|uniref:L,D-transpeptidase n=1 Tax=Legionella genomosp. 1 TaxID=1093625 RepID=UPI00105650C4|nr:L,D-transpeptidase [Legionella genomosp. 1]
MEARNLRKFILAAFAFCVFDNAYADNAIIPDNVPHINVASNTFIFNPRKLTWVAISSNGKVVRSGKASGGSHYCRDIKRSCKTPSGTYRVMSKSGAGCRSSRYPLGKGGAPMPYCMFFSKYYAIHGSPDVPNYNASHGCIRVRPGDAKWLNQNFVKIGTKVIVRPY